MQGTDPNDRGKVVLIYDSEAEWYCERLRAAHPGCTFLSQPGDAVDHAKASMAHVLVALAPRIHPDLVGAMPRLEWIQALTTGIDNLSGMRELAADVVVTNVRGIHGPQMSELAMLLMMASVRKFPALVANQSTSTWERWPQPLLYGKTVCVVGLGSIAEALVPRCVAFGMDVTGVSDGRREMPGCRRIFPRDALNDAVADADFVVVLVPYSARNHHLVDEAALRAMKPSAVLVNLSRGHCVSEDAVERSLKAGVIAGAALDVFATEPLPASHQFWTMPNVIVSPHIGGMSDVYAEQALPVVSRNVAAYLTNGAAGLSGGDPIQERAR